MTRIVVLDGYTTNPGDLDWSELESLGELKVYERTRPEEIVIRAGEADVLLTNKVRITEEIFHELPALKLICVMATGYDVVDLSSASKHGVIVCNVRGYSTPSVVQHTFSLILSLLNRSYLYHQKVKDGSWNRCPDFSFWDQPINELENKTLGIVGFGDIGKSVAKVGLAFGMKVISSHSHPDRDAIENVSFLSLEELLVNSDIVSLHCPLKEDNYHMINDATLSFMKEDALLVNTARGGLVDLDALERALRENRLGGAGLDVLEAEPPLTKISISDHPNCVITPHQAWASQESRQRLMQGLAANVRSFLAGHPKNVVS